MNNDLKRLVDFELRVNAILIVIEKLALEYALNLEYDLFAEVMDLHGVSHGEYEYYFIVLTEFLELAYQSQLDAEFMLRAKNAHRFVRVSRNELGTTSKLSLLACSHLLK